MVNGLILGFLIFVTVGEIAPNPPTIQVTSIPEPEEPPIAGTTLERPQPSVQAGGSTLLSAPLAITTAATSELSMTVPDLPSIDDGVLSLEGLGLGFGLDTGFGTTEGSGSMQVGRIKVTAMRLGVILDVSASMEEELPKVRRDLNRAFRQAKTVDVEGCRIDWRAPPESELRRVSLKPKADSVIEAVEMLVVEGKVDAIYWFSDLQDGQSDEGIRRLGELLRISEGRANAVRFYIRSLGQSPSPEMTAIVRASGGAIQAGEEEEE